MLTPPSISNRGPVQFSHGDVYISNRSVSCRILISHLTYRRRRNNTAHYRRKTYSTFKTTMNAIQHQRRQPSFRTHHQFEHPHPMKNLGVESQRQQLEASDAAHVLTTEKLCQLQRITAYFVHVPFYSRGPILSRKKMMRHEHGQGWSAPSSGRLGVLLYQFFGCVWEIFAHQNTQQKMRILILMLN